MKKINSILFVFAIGILFSSCKSNLAINKRHYTNGYHIVRSEAKCRPAVHQIEKSETEFESKKLSSAIIDNSNSNNSNSKIELSNNNNASSINTVSSKREPIVFNKIKHFVKKKAVAPSIFSKVKQQLEERSKTTQSTSGDELSLLWIVILILLILWALGFISGGFALGSIINLLLLAALILLILWLLHII